MNCSNCRHTNASDALYCNNCGLKLTPICSQCGKKNPIGSRFCNGCGNNLQVSESTTSHASNKHELPLETSATKAAERRQLTCLFCDLVGSTPLSEKLDAEDYRQVILDYQQIAEAVIIQYGGHVAQYLGDGLLVYFGYPAGLENAPKTGIQAGLGIIEALAQANKQRITKGLTPINIRIGINTGLVVVDDHLAMGDTVNIAARLEGLAPTNGLVISAQTLKLVQGWFEVNNLGKRVLKGIKKPMEVFQVVKASGVSSRIEIAVGRGLSPLVGREEEVYNLLRTWKKAKDGKGQLLLLNGEAGIGKSRLVESLKGQVKQESKAAKLEIRCSDYHVHSPFYPLIDVLEKRILHLARADTTESKIIKLEAWMETSQINKNPNLPIYADLLSIPISDDLRRQYENTFLAPAGKRKKFTEGIVKALANFSLQQPLLLVVEDLHWMDGSTLEWLNQLVDQVNIYPFFILATTRPQFQATWPNRKYTSQVFLGRLNTDRIKSICHHQTHGKTLPKEIVDQIKAKTDGVPLFVEELTRMIIESDLLLEKDTHYELNPAYEKGFELAVPSTLQDSLIARLDNLSRSRSIAQIGAVLGRSFSFPVLCAVAQKEENELQGDLNQLVEAQFLFQKESGNQSIYIFKHALIQDTAYQTLLKSKRRQIHKRVVTVLQEQFPELIATQPELIAHHATEAGLNELALLMWEKAGNKAALEDANSDAVQHFQKAFTLIDKIEQKKERNLRYLDLLIPYSHAILMEKGFTHPEVEKNAQRILELCEHNSNPQRLMMGYYELIIFYMVFTQFEKALEAIEKGALLARELDEIGFLSMYYACAAEIHLFCGNFRKAVELSEMALENYDHKHHTSFKLITGQDVPIFAGFIRARSLGIMGFHDQAKKETLHYTAIGIEDKSMVVIWRAHYYPLQYYTVLKEYGKGMESIKPFLPIIESTGEIGPLLYSQLGFYACAANLQVSGALDKAQEILNNMKQTGLLIGLTSQYSFMIDACIVNRNFKQGMDYVNKAMKLMNETHELKYESCLYRQKGELLLLETHKSKEAESSFLHAIDIAKTQDAKWWELLASKSLARLWQSQGEFTKAHEVLNQVYSWFTEGFETEDMVEAKELLVELKIQTESL